MNQEKLERRILADLGQTRRGSAFESIANVAVGYFVAILTQIIVFPLLSIEVTVRENFILTTIFTVVSIVRSYTLRRIFNHFR